MPGWVGPTVALSLLVIALSVVAVATTILFAFKKLMNESQSLAKEIRELRTDLAPTLDAVKRLGEKGLDVVQMAEEEARSIVETTRRIRYDVERGVKRAKNRLADFEAVVEVAQEELESTVVDVSAALQTARAGVGMIGRLRRLVRPRRRGAA